MTECKSERELKKTDNIKVSFQSYVQANTFIDWKRQRYRRIK